MPRALRAAFSSDIDTLQSIYRGRGCRRPGGYTYSEFRSGLDNFCRFLEPYGVRSTCFMVGDDFLRAADHDIIREVARRHEIGNHTMTHAQGFRLLSPSDMEQEIAAMEEACESVIGARPVAFRSPGWNVGDSAAPILQRRGYLYDSSVHPSVLTPLFKALHWWTTPGRPLRDRTTLGHWHYMLAPLEPYRASAASLGRRGSDGIVEIPVTVVPFVRVPFWATFALSSGFEVFQRSYRFIRAARLPIHFQFHLSDFVEYTTGELASQVPAPGDGLYVPRALREPLARKIDLFRRVMDTIVADYTCSTLQDWASEIAGRPAGAAPA